MQKIKIKDIYFMKRALKLASRGVGRVHPNPLVGALLVKNGSIIGEGAHEYFGGPHAEVNAIRSARRSPHGGTLYVTMEPCAHYGKTPPCTDILLKNHLKKIIVGCADPNPLVRGKGLRLLQRHKVRVKKGLLEKECTALNKDYNYWMRSKTPYVIVKSAQSLDGKIATKIGQSKWITGLAARKFSHGLRAQADLVMIGVNTVLKDDPLLSVRHGNKSNQPAKVVLDCYLRTPLDAAIFSKKSKGRVLIATSTKTSPRKRKLYLKKAELIYVAEKKGKLDLKTLFKILGKKGFVRVLAEGGGEVIGDLFDNRLVNEAYFFIAPTIIGGRRAVLSVAGEGVGKLSQSHQFRYHRWMPLGEDFVFHGAN